MERYYIVPDIEQYKRLPKDSDKAKALSRKIAANIGDYASLRLILGIDPPEFAHFYPDMEVSTPSTFDTIDSFLDKFGTETPPAEPIAWTPDNNDTPAAEYNLADEKEKKSKETGENEKPFKDIFSKLVKEQRYQEALEFIEQENLKNPNKSIYFAHQIRFLKKLIAIHNHRNNPESRRVGPDNRK